MGIMPEIERVWISIDHKLFLWNYVEGYALYLIHSLSAETELRIGKR